MTQTLWFKEMQETSTTNSFNPFCWSLKKPVRNLWHCVRFEVFMSVTMENVFWDVTPCGSCKNRRFGGTKHLHHQGDTNMWTKINVNHN
jgi:hypothetical protein